MAKAAEFKFGIQLGFAKAHHKNHNQRKSGRGLGLGKLPNIWGSALIFLQRPRCPLSVSTASCYFYIRHEQSCHNSIILPLPARRYELLTY